MHPHTIPLLCLFAACMLVQLLHGRTVGWWCWQDTGNVLVGVAWRTIRGLPPHDGVPNGFRSSHSITLGCGLYMVRVHWFARVPTKWRGEPPV